MARVGSDRADKPEMMGGVTSSKVLDLCFLAESVPSQWLLVPPGWVGCYGSKSLPSCLGACLNDDDDDADNDECDQVHDDDNDNDEGDKDDGEGKASDGVAASSDGSSNDEDDTNQPCPC